MTLKALKPFAGRVVRIHWTHDDDDGWRSFTVVKVGRQRVTLRGENDHRDSPPSQHRGDTFKVYPDEIRTIKIDIYHPSDA